MIFYASQEMFMLVYFLILSNLFAQNDESSEEDNPRAKNFRGFLDTTFEMLQVSNLQDGMRSTISIGGLSGDPQYIWAKVQETCKKKRPKIED